MAAERDEAGPGAGLSGTGRDTSGLEAGTTRSASMGDPPGSADVHAGIAFNTTADEGLRERTVNRVKDATETVTDAAGSLGSRARTVAGDVAERAGDMASRARDRVSSLTEGARNTLEERGWLDRLKENPLPALGVAFAAGFLLAGGGRGGTEIGGGARGLKGSASRMRGELRGALAAGLSAGLAQGARSFLRNIGAEDGVINSVIQNLPGMESESSSQGSRGGMRPASRSGGGRMASSGARGSSYGGGSMGGSSTRHREPSHRENL